jgi:hypothetical protein
MKFSKPNTFAVNVIVAPGVVVFRTTEPNSAKYASV